MRTAKTLWLVVLLLALFLPSGQASQLIINPKFLCWDDNGDPVGCCIYTYTTGTNTPLATYSDKGLTTTRTNPIQADARGEVGPIYGSGVYRIRLGNPVDGTCPATVSDQEWYMDNVEGVGSTILDFTLLSEYTSFANAVDTIGATETELWIDESQTLTRSETIPKTLKLIPIKGNILTLSNFNMTINSPFPPVKHQCFSENNTGKVVFGNGAVQGGVYPEMWGAAHDGATDDGGEITDAIAAVSTAGGKVLIDGGGTYLFNTNISLANNVTLQGDKQTTLKSSNGASMTIGSISRPSAAISYNDVSLIDLIVQGSGAATDPTAVIDIWETRRVRVEGCTLHTTGVLQDGNRDLVLRIEACADVSVKNNYIYDINGTGVLIFDFEGHVQVTGNHIRSCADDCINVQEDAYATVDDDNTFVIDGNTVELCGLDRGEGIKATVEDTDRFMGVISDNAIYRPCQEGIILRWPSDAGNPTVIAESQVVISGNVIKDAGWAEYGSTSCTDNSVGKHLLSGIRVVNGHSHVIVTGNSIKKAYGYGIGASGDSYAGKTEYLNINNNIIEDVVGYGIYTADTDEVFIKHNIIDTVSTGSLSNEAGISVGVTSHDNMVIEGNLITNMGALDGIHIDDVTPVNVIGNKIDGCDEGIVFNYSSGTPWIQFVNNTVVNATGNGIEFPTTANEDITGGDWKGNHITCTGDQLAGPTDVTDAPDSWGTISGETDTVMWGEESANTHDSRNIFVGPENGAYLMNVYITVGTTITANDTNYRTFKLLRNCNAGQQIRQRNTTVASGSTITQWDPFDMNGSGGFVSGYCFVQADDSVCLSAEGGGTEPALDYMTATIHYITF